MCDFLSYIERNGTLYYLTDKDLNTAKGKKLIKEYGIDISGHGAIREFYDIPFENHIEKEQTDFSSPDNFPKEIATAIKNCEITKLGIEKQLLNESGWEKYLEIENSAMEKHEEIEKPAWGKYLEIKKTAWEKYKEIKKTAMEKYEEIKKTAMEKYEEIVKTAMEKYEEIKKPAWEKYLEIKKTALWKIFKQKKYRNKAWR